MSLLAKSCEVREGSQQAEVPHEPLYSLVKGFCGHVTRPLAGHLTAPFNRILSTWKLTARLQQENSFTSLLSFKPPRQILHSHLLLQATLAPPHVNRASFSPPAETWRKLRPASPFNRPLESWDSASSVNRDRMGKRQHLIWDP
jgi:hypothetical protein